MSRATVLLFAFAGLLCAAEDAREIVRRSVEADESRAKLVATYTFIERQEERQFDSSGRVKSRKTATYDITLTEGSPYRRPIARDDRPLPPDEEAKERKKLEKSIAERRTESPEQREKRLADWRRSRERQRAFLRELPDAFDFVLVGEDMVEGRKAYAIDAAPRRGYRPKTRYAAFLPKMKGRLWIDAEAYDWVKCDAETIDSISFGGILARLYPGARMSLVQTRVNNEVWLPKQLSVKASGRFLFFKRAAEVDVKFSDYRKFQTDTRILAVEESGTTRPQ